MIRNRITEFTKSLKDLDGVIVDDPIDLVYLTGLSLSKGRLWITPSKATLYLDGRYYQRAQSSAPCSVEPVENFKRALKDVKKIGFDSAATTFDSYLDLKKQFPDQEWIPLSKPLKNFRICKDSSEVESLKKAAELTWKGYRRVLELLKEGVLEEELAFEFELFCRKHGGTGLSFEPIIAFGENSAFPHHRAGKATLKKNQIVLIDVGAIVEQYHGDMTRIFFFGIPDPELLRFEQIVKRAKEKAIAHVRPGVPIGKLDQIVVDEFEKEGVRDLYLHSLGHGIGLETHEYPRIIADGGDANLLLEPGMVFTIEPGLYKPGVGGIRLEDMILVTEKGHLNFMSGLDAQA